MTDKQIVRLLGLNFRRADCLSSLGIIISLWLLTTAIGVARVAAEEAQRGVETATNSVDKEINKLRLDHIGIWVADTEKTSLFFTEIMGWKRHPMEFTVIPEDTTTGGIQGMFFDANGLWLKTISPTEPAPEIEILNEKAKGAIVELNFEPDNYQGVLDDMKARGIGMLDMDGSALGEDGGVIKESLKIGSGIDDQGQRLAYWPRTMTGGTTVEIHEYSKNNHQGLINIRNKMWEKETSDPRSPRADRLAIMVRDLEQTAGFYTDVLGLRRHPMEFGVDAAANESIGGMKGAFIDANGVWLALVQPTGPGPLMDYLDKHGDGHIAELIVEVDDLTIFYDRMKAKGITLTNIDGTPLTEERKYHLLEPYGDKLAYIPEDVSCGITIEVFERGSHETSLIHRRDDSWHD